MNKLGRSLLRLEDFASGPERGSQLLPLANGGEGLCLCLNRWGGKMKLHSWGNPGQLGTRLPVSPSVLISLLPGTTVQEQLGYLSEFPQARPCTSVGW